MAQSLNKPAPKLLVIMAFATVYVVWGSTYFFIQVAMGGFPPMLLGAIRFFTAGMLLLTWCIIKGERIFIKSDLVTAAIVGILLLVGGNGIVIWVEQTLPSAFVAIFISSAPIWFVLLDKPNWALNLKNKATVTGLIIGFLGILLLFGGGDGNLFGSTALHAKLPGMLLMVAGSVSWTVGSLYAKRRPVAGSATVNVAWQMIIAGLVFLPFSLLHHEFNHLYWRQIPLHSYLALAYLIVFGSIAAYSAYVWLLQVRPVTQVSTYGYVNPVIAVMLGVLLGHEHIALLQLVGLLIILGSVLLINLPKLRKQIAA